MQRHPKVFYLTVNYYPSKEKQRHGINFLHAKTLVRYRKTPSDAGTYFIHARQIIKIRHYGLC